MAAYPQLFSDRPLRAFSTLGCADLTLDEVLALAHRHGLPAVELRALAGSVDLATVFTAVYGTAARLAERLVTAPARIVGLGTSVRLMAERDGDRDALLALAPWAEAAGVPFLRLFDGGETSDAAEIAKARSMLQWWRKVRRDRNWTVDIIVETHDALAHPMALARFLAAVPDAALLWDTHHTWKRGGQDPIETWHMVGPHTRHIHVKDSVSRRGPRPLYCYVLPGRGEFPMAALRAALAASDYRGVVSLEWERLWHPELPPLEDALVEAAACGWW